MLFERNGYPSQPVLILKPTVRRAAAWTLSDYVHGRPVTCTSYIARTHTLGPDRRWVGTDQPRRSNTIVLYVAKRRPMYLVCNFKKTAPLQTLVRADMPDSPDNLIG